MAVHNPNNLLHQNSYRIFLGTLGNPSRKDDAATLLAIGDFEDQSDVEQSLESTQLLSHVPPSRVLKPTRVPQKMTHQHEERPIESVHHPQQQNLTIRNTNHIPGLSMPIVRTQGEKGW